MSDAVAAPSALRAWAETVFDGHAVDVEAAPGSTNCPPEDLISVYLGAAMSGRNRHQATKPEAIRHEASKPDADPHPA